MKLQVKTLPPNPASPGGCYVLADENGEALPMQQATRWECSTHEFPRVHVTFSVDGDKIRLADGHATEATEVVSAARLDVASAAFAALSPANRARFCAMYDLAPIAWKGVDHGG
jgi:hypothetical protein